ncbi:hypothetical protein [Steroidobacter sp.]|uniref:hypothetical protein n=1 Tax=Steroidobacter sp. TaxID=1978227 RepID=UPI001A3760C6|nr:hypothetical protein [Steroidobacter sp.]MBL8267726.1 hypothetical protein [Steroidobacter sp.]
MHALVAAVTLLFLYAADSAHAANPLGIAFKTVTNVPLYAKPTGMLITGRCNRYDPAFQAARAKGAEVLAYINPVARPDHYVCALDTKYYMNDIGQVPLWPYPTYGQRSPWPNTRMTDIRAGSEWSNYVVSFVEGLMREGKVDGVFLDAVGVRPWASLAEWNSWPTAEKNAFAAGNVDLVRRLDARRRAINPDFIIVANNVWEAGTTKALEGERYIDGVMIEHPKPLSPWHVNYVKKPFGNLGHRRVLVVANTRADAQAWAKIPGVTHVSDQTSAQYKNPNTPPVAFQVLNDR